MMDRQEIESRIIELLRNGPMLQKHIVDAFALDLYTDVARVVRDLDERGLVTREKAGNSKLVTLK